MPTIEEGSVRYMVGCTALAGAGRRGDASRGACYRGAGAAGASTPSSGGGVPVEIDQLHWNSDGPVANPGERWEGSEVAVRASRRMPIVMKGIVRATPRLPRVLLGAAVLAGLALLPRPPAASRAAAAPLALLEETPAPPTALAALHLGQAMRTIAGRIPLMDPPWAATTHSRRT